MKLEEKQLCGYFKLQIGDIASKKTWTKIRKGNLKRETESLLIKTQRNTTPTNL